MHVNTSMAKVHPALSKKAYKYKNLIVFPSSSNCVINHLLHCSNTKKNIIRYYKAQE